jgi:hypothetical protein
LTFCRTSGSVVAVDVADGGSEDVNPGCDEIFYFFRGGE